MIGGFNAEIRRFTWAPYRCRYQQVTTEAQQLCPAYDCPGTFKRQTRVTPGPGSRRAGSTAFMGDVIFSFLIAR